MRVSKSTNKASQRQLQVARICFVADDSLIASNPVSIMRAFSETEKGKEDEKEKEAESAR